MSAVMMAIESLAGVRRAVLPTGLSIRMYREGDEDLWVDIHLSTGTYGSVSDDLFEREFGSDRGALAVRQFYVVEPGGNAVATATAWFPHEGLEMGRVHWVAVRPEHQRRGIASALVSVLSDALAWLGHRGGYLTTGSENLPAIALYLSSGFRPLAPDAEDIEAWRKIAERLPKKHSETVLAAL